MTYTPFKKNITKHYNVPAVSHDLHSDQEPQQNTAMYQHSHMTYTVIKNHITKHHNVPELMHDLHSDQEP